MTAALHRDFIDLAMTQRADQARTRRRCSASPVDLCKVDVDTYVVAGIADHICPWQTCYRTHPAARRRRHGSCCPPAGTSPRWSTRRATRRPASRPRPHATRPTRADVAGRGRQTVKGSWWPDYVDLAGRAQRRPSATSPAGRVGRRAPSPLLRRRPGTYVHRPLSAPHREAPSAPMPHRRGARQSTRSVVGRGRGARSARPTAAAAAVQRHRRQPGAAAAVRRRARPRPSSVIRFDVPGVGGSPLPRAALPLHRAVPLGDRDLLTELGHDEVDVLGISWGGGAGPAVRAFQPRRRVPPAGAGRHRHRLADGAGPTRACWPR